MRITTLIAVIFVSMTAGSLYASSGSTGQRGLVHMPDARVGADGELHFGFTRMQPYTAAWASITLLPRLEVSGRFTQVDDVVAFGGVTGFGDYKDKAFDLKLMLLRDDGWLPAVSVGVQDFHGTRLFPAEYLVASKRLGDFDLTLGVGRDRMDGPFGGIRWDSPLLEGRIKLLLEYDAYDYSTDFHARQTGRVIRDGGLTTGVEYIGDHYAVQLSHQDGVWGFNAYLRLPLQQRTFISKTEEPRPVQLVETPGTDWERLPDDLMPLHEALVNEGFSAVFVRVERSHIRMSLAARHYSTLGRATGRVARIVSHMAPERFESLELTFIELNLPVVTYHFRRLDLVRGYWAGTTAPEELTPSMSVSYVDAARFEELHDTGMPLHAVAQVEMPMVRHNLDDMRLLGPKFIAIGRGARQAGITINPFNLDIAFNDPSGAFRYDLHTRVTLGRWLSDNMYFSATGRLTLLENVSETIGTSNSVLPRVRSEITEYVRETGRLGLVGAHIGHIANPADRVYTWFSAGYLERMFGGIGGEVLYLPETGNWAVDAQAFAVKQRDFNGGFGFRSYDTVTALVSYHHRLPSQGLTFTARAGRFLAKDMGVRFEVKRRFFSGFEVGGWYSYTDGKDITSPGSPDSPYRDKGVFLRMAVGPFIARDSTAGITTGLSAWSRDPGQMLNAPGGLYSLLERSLMLNLESFTPWSDFGQ